MELIEVKNLLKADILLYRGSRWVSKAIRFFDNAEFNHASIFLGDNQVLEAVTRGVLSQDVQGSISHSDTVAVYRLTERPSNVTPVIENAKKYVNRRYGYEQIFLLALICATRSIRLNSTVAEFVSKVFEKASLFLLNLTNGDYEALICSELVYRSYDEAIAGYNDPYTIYLNQVRINISAKNLLLSEAPSINQGSLMSYFYGVNQNTPFRISAVGPYVDVAKVSKRQENLANSPDDEMEKLFGQVQQSYINEDYKLIGETEMQLKNMMDVLIVNSVRQTSADKNFHSNLSGGILDSFLRNNSNFITPGDLSKAINLQKIGNIK